VLQLAISVLRRMLLAPEDMMLEIHAYLAGPDVFFPNARDIGRQKRAYLQTLGVIGHFPLDNEAPPDLLKNPAHAIRFIGDANEKMMLDCCLDGRIGLILANMSPFHGPSMDVGTAFEVGFMSALSYKRNVIIIGYTSDKRSFEERVAEEIYGGWINITHKGGIPHGPDGTMIEAFGGADNLMITNAIVRTGGDIFPTFEDAAQFGAAAAKRLLVNPDRHARS
jgi:nucleoside 2-deoxyribosyltransferase